MYHVKFLLCALLVRDITSLPLFLNSTDQTHSSMKPNALYVAGVASIPFVFYVANTGNLEGIDISLVQTVASKLGTMMFIDVVAANKSDPAKVLIDSLGNRYSGNGFFPIVRKSQVYNICRQIDVLLGGLPQYSHNLANFDSSISYYSDDYTWCVQRPKFLPLSISFFRILPPVVWILIVGLGYVNALILYLLVQFDSNPRIRKLDLHHTTFLISLPSWIGISQQFKPNYWPLRLYYISTLLFGMVVFAIFSTLLVKRSQVRLRFFQVQSVSDIVAEEFGLAGSLEIYEHIRHQSLVSLSDLLREAIYPYKFIIPRPKSFLF